MMHKIYLVVQSFIQSLITEFEISTVQANNTSLIFFICFIKLFKVPMKWKIIAAYLTGFKKIIIIMTFSFQEYLPPASEILTPLHHAN